jgi:hypothetical protein
MALKNKTHDIEKAASAHRAAPQVAHSSSEHEHPLNPVIALQQATTAPRAALKPTDILALQRTVGNRAVGRILNNQQQALPIQSSTPVPAIQRKTEEEPLQAKSESRRKENRTGLPDGLKTGIESLSGLAMDDVKVHYNSAKPAQINALAYTQGTEIHLGPGEDEHLPHEAWHVVQQKRGRVKPTLQMKGLPINDDDGMEREADVMGGLLSQGAIQDSRSPQSMTLDASSRPPARPLTVPVPIQGPMIQRVIKLGPKKNPVEHTLEEIRRMVAEEIGPDRKTTVDFETNLLNFDFKDVAFKDLKALISAARKKPKVAITAERARAVKKATTKEPTKEELAAREEKEKKAIEENRKENKLIKEAKGFVKVDNLNKASNYATVAFSTLPDEVRAVIGHGHRNGTEGTAWWRHTTNPETGKAGDGITEYKPLGNDSKIRLVGNGPQNKWYYCPDHTIHGNYTYHEITGIT